MKKTLASILTGISLAFGSMTSADELPIELNLQSGKYYTIEQITINRQDDALRPKVLDNSPTIQVYVKGQYTSDGTVTISYSEHPFGQPKEEFERELRQGRTKQIGWSSNTKIYVGIPEGTKTEVISQKSEVIKSLDRLSEINLQPMEKTRYAKTFLKMGNEGTDKLREYDPIQKVTESLNDSIFLLTGNDLNLADKISIYGILKTSLDNIDKKAQERGKSSFKGELELKEIPLYPYDGIIPPSETAREISFKISPGTYSEEKIPFTVYQKLVLGTERTEGIGQLEIFFAGEINNPNAQTSQQVTDLPGEWIIFLDKQDPEEIIYINQKKRIASLPGKRDKYEVRMESENKYTIIGQIGRNPEKKELLVIEKEGNQWKGTNKLNDNRGYGRLIKIDTLSEFLNTIIKVGEERAK